MNRSSYSELPDPPSLETYFQRQELRRELVRLDRPGRKYAREAVLHVLYQLNRGYPIPMAEDGE